MTFYYVPLELKYESKLCLRYFVFNFLIDYPYDFLTF